MVTINSPKGFEATLHQRLKQSDTFRVYQEAFRTATGLPLRLVGADPDHWDLDEECVNRSPFCEHLNICDNACNACIDTNRRLMHVAEVEGPASCHCFAGLMSTAIPVRMGATIIGFLRTGQVFSRVPTEKDFDQFLGKMGRKNLSADAEKLLRDTYFLTRTIEPERYEGMVKLLESFAAQLGQHAESLAIIEEGSEPAAISKARKYIHQHLDHPLPLGDVARVAGLSESHFCRLFKDATGLTLTDYVNRCRVEWAKKELLRPELRVSEIAFHVGYQSLSQFNRSFARIVGTSPTHWRSEQLRRAAS
jgi:AraC-like DNA-binding protein/ligand-binding sensor protein